MSFITEPARNIPVIDEVDVIVAGGGPAGIGAAIAAARNGARTMIVEQFGCLGGTATSGIHTHVCRMTSAQGGQDFILGGIPIELCRRAIELDIGTLLNGSLDFELEGMKRLLDNMVLETGCSILYHSFISDAIMVQDKLTGIIVENKSGRSAIKAKMVVDCTGDADVAARAGVLYDYGREQDGMVQPVTLMFRVGGCDTVKVRKFRRKEGPKLTGVWAKAAEAGDMEPFQNRIMGFWLTHSRPDQIGVNFTNLFNINGTDAGDLTKAQIECRKQAEVTVKVMKKYIPGCEDAYIIDTAPMLGVRETRRIKGEYTLTIEDVLETRKFDDGIAKGSFYVDIHNPVGAGLADDRQLPKGSHYDIPYGCIIPQKMDNLLVAGRCISATHEALGSTRVMFQCMALGQAAGTAAAISCAQGIAPRKLDVKYLRKVMAKQGVIL